MLCTTVHENGREAVKMHCIIPQDALCAETVQLGDQMNTVVHNIQHNSNTRALPQRISSFPLWFRCWIRGPTLAYWCALAKSWLQWPSMIGRPCKICQHIFPPFCWKGKRVSVITSPVTKFSRRFQDFSTTEKEIKLDSLPDGCRRSGRESAIRTYPNAVL